MQGIMLHIHTPHLPYLDVVEFIGLHRFVALTPILGIPTIGKDGSGVLSTARNKEKKGEVREGTKYVIQWRSMYRVVNQGIS